MMYDQPVVAFIDAGSHGSPGPSGIGIAIKYPNGEKVSISKYIGHQDNNCAEYLALLVLFTYAAERGIRHLLVKSDSEVVVRQVTGHYQCRSQRLKELNQRCKKAIRLLLARSATFTIIHIPREENREANDLARAAILAATTPPRLFSSELKKLPLAKYLDFCY